MPPVSLPWNGGTVSARTGPHASIPHTATKLAAPIIRIADSISSLVDTLRRIARHGKNGGRQDAELSPTVATLHLTRWVCRFHGRLPPFSVTISWLAGSGQGPARKKVGFSLAERLEFR